MGQITIEPSKKTPKIEFYTDGKLTIEGRSLPENPGEFYAPLIDFAEKLESQSVTMEINLEYFNTSSSKKLIELLKVIDANSKVGEFTVNWHYEFDDDDSLETAEIYEESLFKAVFRYIGYNEM